MWDMKFCFSFGSEGSAHHWHFPRRALAKLKALCKGKPQQASRGLPCHFKALGCTANGGLFIQNRFWNQGDWESNGNIIRGATIYFFHINSSLSPTGKGIYWQPLTFLWKTGENDILRPGARLSNRWRGDFPVTVCWEEGRGLETHVEVDIVLPAAGAETLIWSN